MGLAPVNLGVFEDTDTGLFETTRRLGLSAGGGEESVLRLENKYRGKIKNDHKFWILRRWHLEDGVPLVEVEDGDRFLSSRRTPSGNGDDNAVSTYDKTW